MADADLYTPEEIALFGASPEAIAAYRAARAIKTAANTLPAAKGMLLGEGLKGILNPTSFVTSNFLRIAGPSQFNDDTMFGRPYPMPGSVMPPITGTETANALTQEQWSNVLQENPDLLAAYTGGAGVDLGGGFILTNRGLFDSGSNRIISTPPLVPVETPVNTGGGGGYSGGDSGSEGDIGSLEPDPDLMGKGSDLPGASTTWPVDAEGNRKTTDLPPGWVYPNERPVSAGATVASVHTNPDGSKVTIFSDGAEMWGDAPVKEAPQTFEKPTTVDGWVKVVEDWLIRFPNASDAEKQEAIQKYGVPAEAIEKAQEGTGTGGQGSGTGTGSSGSGGSTGAPVTPTQPTPQTPSLPRPGPSPAPSTGPEVTPGTGVGPGTGTGTGTGTGGGNGGGTGGLLGLNATRTTEMVFPELYQPKLERFTVLGNLLSNQPWRYRA